MKKVVLLFLVGATLDLAAQQVTAWDVVFRAIPDARNIDEYVRIMSARPHHLGSPYGKQNAEWILARFKEWGWEARIENYDVLFPTPKERLVEMVEPTRFRLTLEEPPVAVDPTSSQKSEQLPSFNAYSVDGDVTGPLVLRQLRSALRLRRARSARHLSQGRDRDRAIRIVLAGHQAESRGRAGSDWLPALFGPARRRLLRRRCLSGRSHAKQGWCPARQRHGHADLPGDPTTPGCGSTPGATRIDLKELTTLTRIPVLPISYGDAQPLLAALQGDAVPIDWRGGLPITYRTGPGPARVHLKLAFDWSLKRVHNVIARLPGSTYPDEWVVRGNHHDAWVNGAQDPASGMSAELEEARALGELVKQGWRPRRTIVYAAWDGEEQGLLGSTEWVEHHEPELRDKAVVYINTDGNGRGFLSAGGSHALEPLVNAVAREVEDPETKTSVWKRCRRERFSRVRRRARNEARSRPDLRISALGSGSDYSAFLQHAGVPTLNLSFSGLDQGDGVYHSIYDDYYHFTKFLDRDFAYGRALAQTVGSLVIRLADADVLPFQFTSLADTVQTYVAELQAQLKEKQAAITELNRQVEEGVFAAIADPRRGLRAPGVETVPPALNFAPLENAASALAQASERYKKALDGAQSRLTPDLIRELNKGLIQSERELTDPAGLPRRPWYRHMLYAPGFYTGYGVKTMPGVREAIEQKDFAEAEREIVRVAEALKRETALVDGLTQRLEQGSK